jgi:hypothetical protein
MDSLDVLGSLIKSIDEEKKAPIKKSVRRQAPPRKKEGMHVRKSGAGGVIFDFGQDQNMHPAFRTFETLMNRHTDHTQAQIAQAQRGDFEKALDNFVDMGEYEFDQHNRRQDSEMAVAAQRGMEETKKSYAHTSTKVGNETVVATSETDAAVMEMFKSEMAMMDDSE